jgi:hypothetical protein
MDAGPLRLLPMASGYRGPLSPACTQCADGQKMVLFVTGLCRFRCFYCPVSERRNQKDVVYANERPVHCDQDVIDEAHAIGASGTGITGGDPLGPIDRTVHYVELLKSTLGPEHNIHLYTHEPNPEKIRRLAKAGLDEVRLHIPHYLWGPLTHDGAAYRTVLEKAPSWGLRRGVEIPLLPDKERELRRLLRALGRLGVDFVNLNELEFSETNEEAMRGRGYALAPKGGWGVDGSRALAQRILADPRTSVPIHYCSSAFKDGVQLRRRLERRLERTAPAFAESTGEGTILLGIVEAPAGTDLPRLGRRLARLARVGPEEYRLDARRHRVELGSGPLRRVARRLELPAFEIEEYPTADALEVERTPLNDAAFPSARA